MIESYDHRFSWLSRTCIESSVPSLVICENFDPLWRERKHIFRNLIQACWSK